MVPPIFEVSENKLTELPKTTFQQESIDERHGLQRLLRDQIAIVAPDVLIISEEFSE